MAFARVVRSFLSGSRHDNKEESEVCFKGEGKGREGEGGPARWQRGEASHARVVGRTAEADKQGREKAASSQMLVWVV